MTYEKGKLFAIIRLRGKTKQRTLRGEKGNVTIAIIYLGPTKCFAKRFAYII